MSWLAWDWVPRLNSRRYRRIFIACLATLGVSSLLLGTVVLVRWWGARAVRTDTRVVLNQAAEQLLRALQSRRGTLTLLRDTVARAPGLTLEEQQALAKSAAAHTRHLIGVGWLRDNQSLLWWVTPTIPATQRTPLTNACTARTKLRGIWKSSSTFTIDAQADRPLLVMFEPLRAAASGRSVVVGVFDLRPLLTDFFELSLQQPYPVQLLEDTTILYHSAGWTASASEKRPALTEQRLHLDALQWTLQMQPGSTHTVQTMSWVNGVLGLISGLGGVSLIVIIWLLAMRTSILQRAVSRRTAALRRTTERLRQLAITDELTGLYNRRFFLERWEWECERAKRYSRPLGCLMIDVDKFKHINDILGHHAGDLVLRHVAQELKVQLRQSDFLARLGGDEFIVALPETSYDQAAAVVEKLRHLAIDGPWTQHERLGPVHLSVGLGHIQDTDAPETIIKRADADLYASRQAARKQQPATSAR